MNRSIVVVTSTLPFNANDPVPAFVQDQVVALKKLLPDYDFTIIAPHDSQSLTESFVSREFYDEYRFHYFWPFKFERLTGRGIMPTLKEHPLYYGLLPFLVIAETISLYRHVRRIRPALIYAHWFTPQGIAAGIVSQLTGIRFAYTSHSSDVFILHKLPFVGRILVRHFTYRAHCVTVVSKRSLVKLKSFFSSAEWSRINSKVATIPMGIDLQHSSNSKSDVRGSKGSILFLGRLAEKKGVQYLLPAFEIVLKNFPQAHLTVAGDGPLMSSLKAQAKKLGFDDDTVTFTGYVSGKNKINLIKETSIYVVPSIITDEGDAEGLPVSLMEGLAASKVCVATNESGADDILTDGVDGFLVAQKDIEGLASAISHGLRLPEKDYAIMGMAAQKTAEQFDWKDIARRYYEFLIKEKL